MAHRSDPWEPRAGLTPCVGRHGPWITYISHKRVQCLACDAVEPMYTDYDVVPVDPTTPLADEAAVRAAREKSDG